jgi:hypothetical protein
MANAKRLGRDDVYRAALRQLCRVEGRNIDDPLESDFAIVMRALHALVPVSQPSVAGTRACRFATSADRLAAATPSPPAALFRRPAPMGVPLPSVAAGPRRLGNRPTGNSDEMASQRLSDLLAVAITLSRTPQDERRNPGPDPSDEPCQSALGRASHCSSSASR